MTLRFNSANPIVDQSGRPTNEFLRGLSAFVDGAVTAALAAQAAAAAQSTATTAAAAAGAAQGAADAAAADAASRQPASTSLSALAALSGTGLVEQTGANAFTDRGIGVGSASTIPTTADADARYVRQGQTAQPSYSTYGGQTVGAAYAQAQVQQIDDKVVAVSTAVASIISKLHGLNAFT